jgi:hypothetical protein
MFHQRRFKPGAKSIRREKRWAWSKASLTTGRTCLPVLVVAGILLSLAISKPVMAKPVTQGKWAQLLVRAMGIEEKVATPGADPQRFIEFLGSLACKRLAGGACGDTRESLDSHWREAGKGHLSRSSSTVGHLRDSLQRYG